MSVRVLWHTIQALRRALFRRGSRGTQDWRNGVAPHFVDPDSVVFWLHHYKGPPVKRSFQLRTGGTLSLRAGTLDRLAIREVLARDIYRLQPFAPNSLDCAIDVGAHIGTFSIAVASKARRVFAFEPDAANYALLRENLDSSRLSQIEPLNKAVAGKAGTLTLALSDKTTGHSAFGAGFGGIQNNNTVHVEAVDLQEFIDAQKIAKVDLLKLDCEGAEYEVVDALVHSDAIARFSRIYLEYHGGLRPEWTGPALASKLEAAGFSVEVIPGSTGADWGQIYAVKQNPLP